MRQKLSAITSSCLTDDQEQQRKQAMPAEALRLVETTTSRSEGPRQPQHLRGSGRAFLEDEMKYLFASIAYASFFACVGFAVYWLKSGWPLFALVFMPSMSTKGDKEVSK